MIAALKAAGVPAVYGFANGSHTESEPDSEAILKAWRGAGYPLGNHTWSHRSLNDLSAADYEADIVRNEPLLSRLSGSKSCRWFRYPFLAEGNDPAKRQDVRRFLASSRYRIAAVTMTYSDYEWNDAYARCRTTGDEASLARLEDAYLDAVKPGIDHWRRLSWAVHGRDIPYVLLTHISPMNARMFPRVLDHYRKAGFRFTTLRSAQRDPAYRQDMNPSLPPLASLEARAAERGLALTGRYDPRPLVENICR